MPEDDKKKTPKKVNNEIIIDPTLDEIKLAEAVLDLMQRRKRALSMRKYKSKLKAARKRMAKRKASPEKLRNRARKKAIALMKKKVSGGKAYADMSAAEKQVVDKKIEKRKAAIERIAKRLIPQVRQAETERMRKMNESLDMEGAVAIVEGAIRGDQIASRVIEQAFGKIVEDVEMKTTKMMSINERFQEKFTNVI